MVDTLSSGGSAFGCAGSSPALSTNKIAVGFGSVCVLHFFNSRILTNALISFAWRKAWTC